MTEARAVPSSAAIAAAQAADAGPWLSTLRLGFALLALAMRLFLQSDWQSRGWADPSLATLSALIVFDAALLVAAFRGSLRSWTIALLTASCLMDLAVYTALSYWTGGPHSPFITLFFPSILIGSLFLSRRFSGLLAAGGIIGLSLVAGAYRWAGQFNPPYPLPGVASEYLGESIGYEWLVLRLLLVAAFLFVLAFAAGWLGEQARSARRLADLILANTLEGAGYFEGGRLLFANQAFHRLLGDAPGDARLPDFFPDADESDRVAELARQARRTPRRLELPPSASRPALELRLSPLSRDRRGGRLGGVLALAIDLTQRREAERLAASFVAARELAAGMAHELSNPLASVRSAAQELGDAFPPQSSQRRLVAIMLRESDRLGRIIADFRKFAAQRPLRAESVRLADVLGDLEALWRRHPDAGRTAIAAAALPSGLSLYADRDQLTEALFNLGANALSMMGGDGRLTVRATLSETAAPGDTEELRRADDPSEPGVRIVVNDTGPGIAPEIADRLFLPFVSRRPGGTGLGLAVARRVIEAHRGRIDAYNPPGGGACFRIWLPCSGPTERVASTRAR